MARSYDGDAEFSLSGNTHGYGGDASYNPLPATGGASERQRSGDDVAIGGESGEPLTRSTGERTGRRLSRRAAAPAFEVPSDGEKKSGGDPSPAHEPEPPRPTPTEPAPTPTEPPRRIKARITSNPRPTYPESARRQGQEGAVLLRLEVSATGSVASVRIESSSGYGALDEAAQAAVRRWEFEPARLGDTPIASRVVVPVRFKLN